MMKQKNTIKSYSDKDLFDKIFQFSILKFEKGEKFHLLLKFENYNNISIVLYKHSHFLFIYKNTDYLICSIDLNMKLGYYVDYKESKIVKLKDQEIKNHFEKNIGITKLTKESKYHLEKEMFQVV